VSAIAPAAFGSFPAYTKRFCNAHQGRFGWDVSGASNVQELHEKLKTVMIRRLKKAVLTQLPDKIRQRVTVEVPPDKLKAMKVGKQAGNDAADVLKAPPC
jgi:SWI/SNF-related matrix-associated actin-dependent regulator 1 of chromatin subfamily A